MTLTIKVISYEGKPLEAPLSAVFDKHGGTLGRSSDNHLVLADNEKFISSEHAIIKHENDGYYYYDTSLNGSLIPNRNLKIHNNKILLKDQDELRIGDYDLIVNIADEASQSLSETWSSPSAEDLSLSIFDKTKTDNNEITTENLLAGEDVNQSLHTDDLFGDSNGIPTISNEYASPINDSFTPPEPLSQPPASGLPDDLKLDDFFSNDNMANKTIVEKDLNGPQTFPGKSDPANADQQPDDSLDLSMLFKPINPSEQQAESKPPVQPVESKPPMQPVESKPVVQQQAEKPRSVEKQHHAQQLMADTGVADDLFTIFLKAAGVNDINAFPKENTPEFMHTVGTVFKELIDGLMTVMRGRAELKSQLRVSMTIMQPAENNPLKFSPTMEAALKTLLTNDHPGFVSAVDAVREGFEDIMNHQLAINAGVQASLETILKRFDPQRIVDKFQDGLILQKKAKFWDEYTQSYQQLVNEVIEDFFGEDFVRAYDEQINKLLTSRKLKRD